MQNKKVVIRTLDIGGDKDLKYMELPKEQNPFLGYRAIRICLDNIALFKTQIRAILRASAFGNLSIMLPMISSIEELREAKDIIEDVKKELENKELYEVELPIKLPKIKLNLVHLKGELTKVDKKFIKEYLKKQN